MLPTDGDRRYSRISALGFGLVWNDESQQS